MCMAAGQPEATPTATALNSLSCRTGRGGRSNPRRRRVSGGASSTRCPVRDHHHLRREQGWTQRAVLFLEAAVFDLTWNASRHGRASHRARGSYVLYARAAYMGGISSRLGHLVQVGPVLQRRAGRDDPQLQRNDLDRVTRHPCRSNTASGVLNDVAQATAPRSAGCGWLVRQQCQQRSSVSPRNLANGTRWHADSVLSPRQPDQPPQRLLPDVRVELHRRRRPH